MQDVKDGPNYYSDDLNSDACLVTSYDTRNTEALWQYPEARTIMTPFRT